MREKYKKTFLRAAGKHAKVDPCDEQSDKKEREKEKRKTRKRELMII